MTKTWKNDYGWLKYAIRSVLSLNKEGFYWVIVCDNGEKPNVQKVVDQARQEAPCPHAMLGFKIYEVQEHWPECNQINNGYFSQQWIKMTANRVMGNEYFLNWDSDVIAVKPISFETFLGKSGRPIYWFSSFNHLIGSGGDRNVHIERMNVMKEVMAINEIPFEYMRCMPVIMNGEILRVGSERAEWSRAFNAIKNGRGGFSEFNIIGLFSHMFFPDSYEWRNAEQQGPTWAGGFADSIMQSHAYVCQSWSWGGLTPDVEKFVNAL